MFDTAYRTPDSIQGYTPELEEVEVELRTPVEKRLEWLCEAWADAMTDDTFDGWYSVRMMIYGASQALNWCDGRHEDRMMLNALSGLAFEYSSVCIMQGKYEGAPV